MLRMIQGIVGNENLRKGLHNYITEFAFSNADNVDFWNAMGEVNEEKIKYNFYTQTSPRFRRPIAISVIGIQIFIIFKIIKPLWILRHLPCHVCNRVFYQILIIY